MNLSNRRGSGDGITRNPFTFAELDDILKGGVSASVSEGHEGMVTLTWSINIIRELTFLFFVNSRMREKYTSRCARAFCVSSRLPTVVKSLHRLSISSSSGFSTLPRSFLMHSCMMRSVNICNLKSSPMKRIRPNPRRFALAAA